MSDPHGHPGGAPRYEGRDVSFRPVTMAAMALVTVITATFGLMWLLNRELVAREVGRSAAPSPLAKSYGRQEPPAPRLQDAPLRDLAALRARERAALESYAWVDRNAGRVRIPVERALELLVGEGRR